MSPRIVAGSLAAYFAGEFANAVVMSKLKRRTKGRHLWARTIGSTVLGQGVDSIVFNVVAFAGIFAGSDLLTIIASGYLLKVAYEVIATPFTYWVVGWLKRKEGVDHFDHDLASYNPFKGSE
jgi:uncharacterized integral membrane protein (TIGR00697 family)